MKILLHAHETDFCTTLIKPNSSADGLTAAGRKHVQLAVESTDKLSTRSPSPRLPRTKKVQLARTTSMPVSANNVTISVCDEGGVGSGSAGEVFKETAASTEIIKVSHSGSCCFEEHCLSGARTGSTRKLSIPEELEVDTNHQHAWPKPEQVISSTKRAGAKLALRKHRHCQCWSKR